MLQDFKSKFKLFLIAAALSAVLAVGGTLLLKAVQPIPIGNPQPSPTPNEAVQWKTYYNTAYNFSVEYPAIWTVDHYPSSSPVETARTILFEKFDERTRESTRQMTTIGILAASNEDALPLKEFILQRGISIDYPLFIEFITPEAELRHIEERVREMKETTFHGFEALQDGENRLFANTGTTVFVFYLHSLENITSEDKEIFDNMLSTFQLIDSIDKTL